MKIFFRIIAIPFFMVLTLIAALRIWFTWNVNFIRFGGEAISYSKNENKCINDIYLKLKNNSEQ